jgi:hypothetical protein
MQERMAANRFKAPGLLEVYNLDLCCGLGGSVSIDRREIGGLARSLNIE